MVEQHAPSGHDTGVAAAPRSEALSIQVVRRARWVENGMASWILKACFRDGSALLATVKEAGFRFFTWSLTDSSAGGWKPTKYGAQRAARRALREGNDHA